MKQSKVNKSPSAVYELALRQAPLIGSPTIFSQRRSAIYRPTSFAPVLRKMTAKTRDAKAHKLVIECLALLHTMHSVFSRLCQIAERSNYPSNHVAISHCGEECGLSEC